MRTLKFQRKMSDGSLEKILELDVLTPFDLTSRGLVKREELGDVVEEISVPELKTYFKFIPPKNGLLVASVQPDPETEEVNPSRFSVKVKIGDTIIPLVEDVAGSIAGGTTWESQGNLSWADIGKIREPFSDSLPVSKDLTYLLLAGTECVKFYYIANKEVPFYFGELNLGKNLQTFTVDPFQTTGILPVLFAQQGMEDIENPYTPVVTVEWLKPFTHAPFTQIIVQDARPEGFNILFVDNDGNLATGMFTESQKDLERDFQLNITIAAK